MSADGRPAVARLGLAAQLKFFCVHGFFASSAADIPEDAVSWLAEQLGIDRAVLSGYDFSGRTGRRHCAEILRHLGFRRMRRADRAVLTRWLECELCPGGASVVSMLDAVFGWCRDHRIFGPAGGEMERLVRSARQRFLEDFLGSAADHLPAGTVAMMEASLCEPEGRTGFHTIKSDAGAATLDNISDIVGRLAFIGKLALPRDMC